MSGQAARAGAGESEGEDPSFYNRIWDLERRLGNIAAGCQAWEQAASRYGEHGLTNNAIALWNKILRLEPSRIRTYLDLATYTARKRTLFDGRARAPAAPVDHLFVREDRLVDRIPVDEAGLLAVSYTPLTLPTLHSV